MDKRNLLPFIVSLFALTSCEKFFVTQQYSKITGVNLNGGKVVVYKDDHGGFLGDGLLYCEVKYKNNQVEERIAESNMFKALPFTQGLNEFFYGDFSTIANLPEIENGYYYFKDKHSESTNPYDDGNLTKRVSFNFITLVYDNDLDKLYIVEFDT